MLSQGKALATVLLWRAVLRRRKKRTEVLEGEILE